MGCYLSDTIYTRVSIENIDFQTSGILPCVPESPLAPFGAGCPGKGAGKAVTET